MLSVFTDVLHVSNLSTAQHVGAVLDQNDTFNKQEVKYKIISKQNKTKSLLDFAPFHYFHGIQRQSIVCYAVLFATPKSAVVHRRYFGQVLICSVNSNEYM